MPDTCEYCKRPPEACGCDPELVALIAEEEELEQHLRERGEYDPWL